MPSPSRSVPAGPPPHRAALIDRARLALTILQTVAVLGAVMRVVLYLAFHAGGLSLGALALVLVLGLVWDLIATATALLPLWWILALFRCRFLGRPWPRRALLSVGFAGLIFLSVAEFLFFEEFNSRFNHIALDYVLFPHEVFVNIWDSYNVPLVILAALAAGAVIAWLADRRLQGLAFAPLPWRLRWTLGGGATAGVALAVVLGTAITPSPTADRIVNEIANNGLGQLLRAFLTADLEYHAFYRTLPAADAHRLAAATLGATVASADTAAPALLKTFTPRCPDRGWDIVVVLEESFGAEFVGVHPHHSRALTPGFDRWSGRGLTLNGLVATGNRTVRGMEGTLCSFVPLPGDAIIKRSRSRDLATIASVLRGQGWRTQFFYGGYGLFDSLKPFALANGWETFTEQPDFPSEAFRTIWGVADEFAFDALLARQRQARAAGERLFATLLTVSNHKPYTVPAGRTGRPAGERSREGAVSYADWSIAHYLDEAEKQGVLAHTLVLIVADHGARVYGAEDIPVESYRIPALIVAPDPAFTGTTMGRLCSQIDLAPTILSMAGITYQAPFLGEDLTGLPEQGGRAFMHHNRDVGMLTDDLLVTLGLHASTALFTRPGRDSDEFTRLVPGSENAAQKTLTDATTAVFQTAYEMYQAGTCRLPAATLSAPAGSPPAPRR